MNIKFIEISGMPDHFHILVGLRPDMSISELVRVIKANSSKWIHETFPEMKGFSWQGGYGAFCVSKPAVPEVVSYKKDRRSTIEKGHFRRSLKFF